MKHFTMKMEVEYTDMISDLVVSDRVRHCVSFDTEGMISAFIQKSLGCSGCVATKEAERWVSSEYNFITVNGKLYSIEWQYDDEDTIKYELYETSIKYKMIELEEDMPF